jgi:hypothetical protein
LPEQLPRGVVDDLISREDRQCRENSLRLAIFDRRSKAKTIVKKGEGDRGDHPSK